MSVEMPTIPQYSSTTTRYLSTSCKTTRSWESWACSSVGGLRSTWSILNVGTDDPEFPNLKASYRQFFKETAKFRQVIEIRSAIIENKIHQTYRLMFLKDVVLARVLDDPTFGILNGFVFFNQSDIVSYMHSTNGLLVDLFAGFKGGPYSPDEPLDERKRDVVLFLHQLMLMGKGVQMPNRLALYRSLMTKGLLFICEWAYTRHEAQILHAGAEILTLAVEHDVNAFRQHNLRAYEAKRKTLVAEMIGMMNSTQNMGLLSQTMDTLRSILDVGMDESVSCAEEI